MTTSRRAGGLGAVAGVLAAGTALGVGQFVAGLTGASGSPVVAVGELQIDFTPPWLKNFAIREFGADDKLILVSGILVVLAIFAAVLGAAATRRMAYGMAGLGVFAVIGLTAAATRPTATFASLLPTLAATAAAVVALRVLIPRISLPAPAARRAVMFDPVVAEPAVKAPEPGGRRLGGARAPRLSRGRRGDRGHRGRSRAGGPPARRAEQRGQRAAVPAHPQARGHHAGPALWRQPGHTGALAVRHVQHELLPGGHRPGLAAGRPVELAAGSTAWSTARSRSPSTSCSSGR